MTHAERLDAAMERAPRRWEFPRIGEVWGVSKIRKSLSQVPNCCYYHVRATNGHDTVIARVPFSFREPAFHWNEVRFQEMVNIRVWGAIQKTVEGLQPRTP